MTFQALEAMQTNSSQDSTYSYTPTGTDADEAAIVAQLRRENVNDESVRDDLNIFGLSGYTTADE